MANLNSSIYGIIASKTLEQHAEFIRRCFVDIDGNFHERLLISTFRTNVRKAYNCKPWQAEFLEKYLVNRKVLRRIITRPSPGDFITLNSGEF